MSTLNEKIKAILEEGSPTSVPGTGKSLVDTSASELSGDEKTSKMTSRYNKSTKQGKLEDAPKGGSSDTQADADNKKIKAGQHNSAMEKLKAESFEALFDGEELTEEFKTKAEAIFEAAVDQIATQKISEAIDQLEEEHQQQLVEAVEEVKGELVEQIDGYLEYVVEQWMQENEIALESGIKVEMVSSFMEGMKKLFEDHYIDVPESKLDVVESQAAEIEVLKEELESAKEEAEKAIIEAKVLKCEAILAELSEDLTVMEAEKLYALAENVDFDTEETFADKVKVLKESFFRKGAKSVDNAQETLAEIKEAAKHSDVDAVLEVLRKKDGIKLIRSSN